MTLTITHTHEEGTLIEGTSRGDGSAEVLKANRWRWSRNLGSWYLPHSRDANAKRWQIDQTAEALREAGFTVDLAIDNTPRATADVQADRVARAADRADALDAKADRLQATSDARHAAADRISGSIPFGQPILVGHHSEGRARRDAERIHSHTRAGFEAQKAADDARSRAKAARANTRPEAPSTTANRIQRLGAELRKCERNGHTVLAERLREQLAYWQEVREQQIADGLVVDTSAVTAGDLVQVNGMWVQVLRANPTTLTVSYTRGVTYRIQRTAVTAIQAAKSPQSPA